MNTISGEFRQEIEDIWSDQIADDASVKAVVFISGKPDNYIAGADIKMISATEDKADLKQVWRVWCSVIGAGNVQEYFFIGRIRTQKHTWKFATREAFRKSSVPSKQSKDAGQSFYRGAGIQQCPCVPCARAFN